MVTRLFALFEQGLGVIGVFEVTMAVVTSWVLGHERVLAVDAEPIGIGVEGEGLSGEVMSED
jgi:hypothetical protein